MSNLFAHVVLFASPLVVVLLFRALPLPQALCWTIIGSYLLLPTRTELNLPMVPSINRHSLPALTALIMCVIMAERDRLAARLPATPPRPQSAPASAPPPACRQPRDTAAVPGRAAALPGALPVAPSPSKATAGPSHTDTAQTPIAAQRGSQGRAVLWLIGLLIAATVIGPFATVAANQAPLVFGGLFLRGLSYYDGLSMGGNALLGIMPFLLAMRFLATPERHRTLLVILVVAGLAYSLPTLWEVRFSPQLNMQVYGFFPHSFLQHIRAGGFRPVVFLSHGLWLGIFLAIATLSALVLWREALQRQVQAAPWLAAALWLGATLVLTRTLGATALTLLAAPVILFASLRAQMLVAGTLAAIVLTYPLLRGADLVPVDQVVSLAGRIDADRQQSFEFRLMHEDRLLDHAARRPLAGWGGYGRNRVFDTDTGRDLTVTDGAWIIELSTFGWIGYLSRFGLLTLPILLLALRRRGNVAPATAGLALVSATAMVDLLPNATLTPVTWLMAGALAGALLRPATTGEAAPAAAAPVWAQHLAVRPSPAGLAPQPTPLRPAPPAVRVVGRGGLVAERAGEASAAPPHRRRPRS